MEAFARRNQLPPLITKFSNPPLLMCAMTIKRKKEKNEK
jgi:hypothetical protein